MAERPLIIPPRVPFVDARTGTIAREWFHWLLNMVRRMDDDAVLDAFDASIGKAQMAETSKQVQELRLLEAFGPSPAADAEAAKKVAEATFLATLAQSQAEVRELRKRVDELTVMLVGGPKQSHAASVNVANEATDTTSFLVFATAAEGSLPMKTNTNMTFNSATGIVTLASSVLTTTDINGGTIDGTAIGGSSASTGAFTTVSASGQITSTVTTGTAPLVIASTTKVSNLNADLLDDQSGAYYLDSANFTGTNWTDLTDGGTTTLHTHTSGTASAITVANEAVDTTCFPVFVTAATGDLAPKTRGTGFTFDANVAQLGVGSIKTDLWRYATGIGQILSDTSDGSDTLALEMSGGGTADPARGAHIELYGNENGISTGGLNIISGDVANAFVSIQSGTSEFKLNRDGDATLDVPLIITGGAGADSLTLPATGRLYLDAGGNTYIHESGADVVQFVTGGTTAVTIGSGGTNFNMALGAGIIDSERLRALFNNTDLTTGSTVLYADGTHTLTGTNAIAFRGIFSNPILAQGANTQTSAAWPGAVQGIYLDPRVTGSAQVNAICGAYSIPRNTGTGTLVDMAAYVSSGVNSGGGAVTNYRGFHATAVTVGGTLNIGFSGAIASGTGRWNAYMSGTALNHMKGGLVIGGETVDGTGTQVLTMTSGTAPGAGVADTVQFYSSDDAAGHTVPSFYCEGTNVVATGQADSASSVRVKMRINGTVRTFLCI